MSNPTDLGTFGVYRGDAWQLPINDTQSDGVTPVDLTTIGTAFTSQARISPDAKTAIDITVDASRAAQGILLLSLDGTQTTAMNRSTYVFDVQATGGPLSPLTLYKGSLEVTKDVTHA